MNILHNEHLLEGNNKENLKILLDLIDDLIFTLDTKGRFRLVNKNGAQALNYSSEELKGKHLLELVDLKQKPSLLKAFHEILSSESIINFEASLISKQGHEIIFALAAKSITENNKVSGIIAVGKNVTKIRKLETELLDLQAKLTEANRLLKIERGRFDKQKIFLDELNQLKNEFITNISHELRTPLASIVGFSEAISSDPNITEQQKIEFNRIILNEGKKLAKLINEVLDLSRVEEHKSDTNKSEFDLILLLNDIIHLEKQKAEGKGIIFITKIPEGEILINGDKESISRAFSIIIGNSIKFTDKGGRVKILCQIFDNEVEVVISDTGEGISKKKLPVIFQESLCKNRNSQPETSGLVFVKKVIDLHKGFISAQSEEQHGSSFLIKLPKK